MGKSTHFSSANVAKQLRLGGVGYHQLGGQSAKADRVTDNWFPVLLPAATAGTPQNSDCATLLDNLSQLVSLFTIQQSVILSNCYRTIQSGVVAGGTFSITPPGRSTVTSGATTSWFDQSINISEAVAVDVVNKNPSLTVDLAMRLAVKAGQQIDKQLAALYASFTIATVGTASTTPTPANLTTQINLIPNTGEPILGFFTSGTLASYLATNPNQTNYNGTQALIQPASANKQIRLLASDNITASTGNRNIIMTPSALSFVSAPLSLSTGSGGGLTVSGTTIIRASNWYDVEFGQQPQLALQLIMGNTGSGVQTVYVNCLGAALCTIPANGAVVLS